MITNNKMNTQKIESLTHELKKLNKALKALNALSYSLSNVCIAVCAIKKEIVTVENLLKAEKKCE